MYLTEPTHELEFRCIGIIKGTFRSLSSPTADDFAKGELILTPEKQISALIINKSLTKLLKKSANLLESEQYWTVFMKTHPKISVQIKHLRNNFANPPEKNIFSIRGIVSSIKHQDNYFFVHIQPNNANNNKHKAFDLKIQGQLSEEARVGQFWDIMATFDGEILTLESASFVKEMDWRPPARPRRPSTRPRNNNYNKDRKYNSNGDDENKFRQSREKSFSSMNSFQSRPKPKVRVINSSAPPPRPNA